MIQSTNINPSKFKNEIQGLRGLAVLAVVLFHLQPSKFSGGFLGVDVFFVISGYLITGIIWSSLYQENLSLKTFYAKRIQRLFPVFFVVIFSLYVIYAFIALPDTLVNLAESAISAVLYTSNLYFHFFTESGYFDHSSDLNPLLHTWSLSVEEQFYFFLPLYLIFVFTFFKKQPLHFILLTSIFLLLTTELVMYYNKGLAFYTMRFWQFLLGGALVFVPFTVLHKLNTLKYSNFLYFLCFLLLIYYFIEFKDTHHFPGLGALIPTLIACLLIITTHDRFSLNGKILNSRPLTFLGDISYSLYLWHWPVIIIYKIQFSSMIEKSTALSLLFISIFIAFFSYKYIEQPIRKLQFNWKFGFVYFMGSLLIIVIAVFIIISDGFYEWRTDIQKQQLSVLNSKYLKDSEADPCFPSNNTWTKASIESFNDECLELSESKPNVLIWGDSYAEQYVSSFKKHFPNVHFSQATTSGCRPLFKPSQIQRCKDILSIVKQSIMSNKQFDTVVLVGRWRLNDFKQIQETISFLQDHSYKVVLFGRNIEYGLDLPSLVYRFGVGQQATMQIANYNNYDQTFDIDYKISSLVNKRGVVYISPFEAMCNDSGQCDVVDKDNQALQFDFGHLTPRGAEAVLLKFKPQLSTLFEKNRVP